MNIKTLNLLIVTLLPLLFFSCNPKKLAYENRIVIGISSDVQNFNTLFAFSYEENMITDILFPGLFDFRWNDEKGELERYPMIAKSWEWSEDSSYIKFVIRDDICWTPNIIAYNKRIKNVNIAPNGVLVHCWEWTLNE